MVKTQDKPVIYNVLEERNQDHSTRKLLFQKIEGILGRPLITYFTSFIYPVMIENSDADMIEAIIQKIDLKDGLALLINSPGGDGLAAERIINICRNYSQTGEFWVIVVGKAKSAATMIAFGASKIFMSKTSELGPIDPQLAIKGENGDKRFSVCNIVKSYENLFGEATKTKGNLEPFLQQLSNYDAKDIEEYKAMIELSADIAVRYLANGMMKGISEREIINKIKIFLSPEKTKTHGRPIYKTDAEKCGLKIETIDIKDEIWDSIYELYIRSDNYVSHAATKCIESKKYASYISSN